MEEKYWGEKTSLVKKAVNNKEITEKHIAVHENKIYFYAGVNRESAAELNKKIGELQVRSFTMANNLDVEPYPIHLYINSGGGSITAGISSMDTILSCKVPVYTYVDGFAASAATFLSVVGTKRFMSRNSYMLIHQLSSGMWGKYEELKDDMENSENLMNVIKDIYNKHTNIPKKELDKVLKHDLWWDAETCLKYGLIDEII